jgi:hypothetical protein
MRALALIVCLALTAAVVDGIQPRRHVKATTLNLGQEFALSSEEEAILGSSSPDDCDSVSEEGGYNSGVDSDVLNKGPLESKNADDVGNSSDADPVEVSSESTCTGGGNSNSDDKGGDPGAGNTPDSRHPSTDDVADSAGNSHVLDNNNDNKKGTEPIDINASDDEKLRALWRRAMEPPPSASGLQDTIKGCVAQGVKGSAKDTSRKAMYYHLLTQLSNPLNVHTKRVMWLDPEFALNLKGMAVMAVQPDKCVVSVNSNSNSGDKESSEENEESKRGGDTHTVTYKPSSSSSSSSLVLQTGPKAIRLSAPTGTHYIQVALARSLAHSVNASVITLDSSTLESMRAKATALGVSTANVNAKKSPLSARNVFAQLFAAAREGGDGNGCSPVVVLLQGRPKWLFESGSRGEEVLQLMMEEMKTRDSRVFFVMTQPNNSIKEAKRNTETAAANAAAARGAAGTESNDGHQQNQGGSSQWAESAFGASPPSSSSSTGPSRLGQMTHVVARIIFRNGTAHLGISSGRPLSHPLPPSDDGRPENANPFFRMPPPEMMKKIMVDNQRWHQGPNSVNFRDEARFREIFPIAVGPVTLPQVPIFSPPPGSSEEEIFEAMRSPENTAIMNGFLDSLMSVIFKNIPLAPEAMPSPDDEPRPIPAGIEIISHQGPSMHEKHLEIKFHMLAPSGLLRSQPPPPSPAAAAAMEEMSNYLPPDPLSAPPAGMNMGEDAEVNAKDPFRVPLRWGMRNSANSPASGGGGGGTRGGSRRMGENSSDSSSKVFGPVARRVLGMFEEVVVPAPKDQALKIAWEQIVSDEVQGRVSKYNTRQLRKQLLKAGLTVESTTLERLQNKLGVNLLMGEDITKALNYAVKLQAGGADCVGLGLRVNGELIAESSAQSPSVLQYWALDVAISSALKLKVSRFGRPMSSQSTKDELANKNLDKYEKALVGNIIGAQELGVTYDMIGGLDGAKESLRQCITYPLKYPWLYSEGIAQEAVKGVLLFGPPGTGKTMLAKAVATEGGATFLTVDAGTIENKWLGESEKNAKAVFTLARQVAPCVVYLDEVDSILSSREQGDDSSHGTLTSVKTTLMQEWDGLRTTKDRVVVIASTNRPFDLDEAVLRRLPRRILVDLPDLKTRTEIMQVTLVNNRLHPDVNLTTIAKQLEGYSGSDIKEVCREAVVRVSHERAMKIEKGEGEGEGEGGEGPSSSSSSPDSAIEQDHGAPLRAVTTGDFKVAMKKLKASVNDNGSEMKKVMEWNSKYGEISSSAAKSRKSNQLHMQMYV